MDKDSSRVYVTIRARPALEREIEDTDKLRCCLAADPGRSRIYVSRDGTPMVLPKDVEERNLPDNVMMFEADCVTTQADSTADVYNNSGAREAVLASLRGLDATIIAYGQTGSGKTYTMGTGANAVDGLCQCAAADLFRAGNKQAVINDDPTSESSFEIRASFIQIYNAVVTDLLAPQTSKQNSAANRGLQLKDVDGRVTPEGMVSQVVRSVEELTALIAAGQQRRAVGATALNQVSSRSHAVVILDVVRTTVHDCNTPADDCDTGNHIPDDISEASFVEETVTGRLCLVDLAGSERVKDSQVTGDRLTEAAHINRSLFSLVHVVAALADRPAHATSGGGGGGGGGAAAHVPYRDSPLTYLLRSALGGPCRTVLVACVSPAQAHAAETVSTLRFAQACRRVHNQPAAPAVRRRLVPRHPRPAAAATRKAPPPPPRPPWETKGLCAVRRTTVRTRGGDVSVLVAERAAAAGDTSSSSVSSGSAAAAAAAAAGGSAPTAVLLHGFPSEAAETADMFPCLVHCGFRCLAVDMPGFGHSPGARLPSRSESNNAPGGPVDIVCDVIRALGPAGAGAAGGGGGGGNGGGGADRGGVAAGVVVYGYDWGGGIALSLALRYPALVSRLVIFHASYQEKDKGELARLKAPTLVLWSERDQFHPWAKWKPLARSIPEAEIELFKPAQLDADGGGAAPRRVVAFLGGYDPAGPARAAGAAAEVAGRDVAGRAVRVMQTLTLDDGSLPPAARQAAAGGGAECRAAVEALRARLRDGSLPALYAAAAGGGEPAARQDALRLFAALPALCPGELAAVGPELLVHYGLWESAPAAWESVRTAARYYPGREVLVPLEAPPLAVGIRPGESRTYMRLLRRPAGNRPVRQRAGVLAAAATGGRCGSAWTCHRGVLLGAVEDAPDYWAVSVPVAADGTAGGCGGGAAEEERAVVEVAKEDILILNQPHVFPPAAGGGGGGGGGGEKETVLLEDGLRMAYDSPLARAKLCEIALRLAPAAEGLRFDDDGDGAAAAAAQVDALRMVVAAMDMTSFQRGLDRGREARSLDCARLACGGQGHCHTMSSTAAALLYPLQHALCVDVCYRGGFSFGGGGVRGDGDVRACGGGGATGVVGAAAAECGWEVSNSVERHQWLEVTLRPSHQRVIVDLFMEDGRRIAAAGGSGCGSAGASFVGMPCAEAYESVVYPHPAPAQTRSMRPTPRPLAAGDVQLPVRRGDVSEGT